MMDRTDVRGKGAAVKAMGVADPGEGRVPLKGGYEEALSSTVRVTGEKKTVAEVFINMDRYNGKRVRELIGVFEDATSSSLAASHSAMSSSMLSLAPVASLKSSTAEHQGEEILQRKKLV